MADDLFQDSKATSSANSRLEALSVRFKGLKHTKNHDSTGITVVEISNPEELAKALRYTSGQTKLATTELDESLVLAARGKDFTQFVLNKPSLANIQLVDRGNGNIDLSYLSSLNSKESRVTTLSVPPIGSIALESTTQSKVCPGPASQTDIDNDQEYGVCEVTALSSTGLAAGISRRFVEPSEVLFLDDGAVVTWQPKSEKGDIRAVFQNQTIRLLSDEFTYGDEKLPVAVSNSGAVILNRKEFNPSDSNLDERLTAVFVSSSGGEFPVTVNGKPASTSIQFSPKGSVALFKTADDRIAVVDTTYDKPGAASILPTPEKVTLPQDFPFENFRGTQVKLENIRITGFGTSSESNAFAGENRRKIVGQGELVLTDVNGKFAGIITQVLSWTQNIQTDDYRLDELLKPIAGRLENGKPVQIYPAGSATSISDQKYGEINFYNGSQGVGADGSVSYSSKIKFSINGGNTFGDFGQVLGAGGLITEGFRELVYGAQINQDMIFVARGESGRLHIIRKDAAAFWQEARKAVGLTAVP